MVELQRRQRVVSQIICLGCLLLSQQVYAGEVSAPVSKYQKYLRRGGSDSGGGFVVAPKLLNKEEVVKVQKAAYPSTLRKEGKEAAFAVAVYISTSGIVDDVEVRNPTGTEFDAAAAKVARAMRFSPAKDLSGPVPSRILMKVGFQLNEQSEGHENTSPPNKALQRTRAQ